MLTCSTIRTRAPAPFVNWESNTSLVPRRVQVPVQPPSDCQRQLAPPDGGPAPGGTGLGPGLLPCRVQRCAPYVLEPCLTSRSLDSMRRVRSPPPSVGLPARSTH